MGTFTGMGRIPQRTGVLVVGAGPTGLTLACALADRGVPHLVVDRCGGVPASRLLSERSLRTLANLGVRGSWRRVSSVAVRDGRSTVLRLDRPAAASPAGSVEAALERHYPQRIWRDTELKSLAGTTAVLGAEDGDHVVDARYVVGCDGESSSVREAIGVTSTPGMYADSYLSAEVRLDRPIDRIEAALDPAGLMVVAPLEEGWHRVVAVAENAPGAPALVDVQHLFDQRGWDVRVDEMRSSGHEQWQQRVADRFRAGGVFLAGGAAHRLSPATGRDLGFQDAADLGRRLAAVVSGRSDPSILDGYERVRRPVAQRTMAFADKVSRIAALGMRPASWLRDAVLAVTGRRALARSLTDR
jgi:2-polyprenyl-6-methoxyphenol hydroxylase-like FAD-dependent oxidoreductase